MTQNSLDATMRHNNGWPSAFERGLDAVARQQAENDNRRRRLFLDGKRRQAVAYEEKFVHDSIARLKLIPSGQEPTEQFTASIAREKVSAPGGMNEEADQRLQARPQLALDPHEDTVRYRSPMVPFIASLTGTVAARLGLADGPHQTGPTRIPPAVIGDAVAIREAEHDVRRQRLFTDETKRQAAVDAENYLQVSPTPLKPLSNGREPAHRFTDAALNKTDQTRIPDTVISLEKSDVRSEDMPRRHDGIDPITQLDPRYTAPLDGQLGTDVSAQMTLGREAEITKAMVDTVTGHVRSQAETGADIPEPILDSPQGRGRDGYRAQSDRIDGRQGVDGPLFDTAANGSAHEALAAAADELERLRAAVRRTINDLERVRGPVQPHMPALPVNRGSFRIS